MAHKFVPSRAGRFFCRQVKQGSERWKPNRRGDVVRGMSEKDLIQKARNRVAQCRRLASMINDPHTRAVLSQMADEAEADIRKFEAERGEQDNERREG